MTPSESQVLGVELWTSYDEYCAGRASASPQQSAMRLLRALQPMEGMENGGEMFSIHALQDPLGIRRKMSAKRSQRLNGQEMQLESELTYERRAQQGVPRIHELLYGSMV